MYHLPRPNSTDFSGRRRLHFTFHSKGNTRRTAIIKDVQGGVNQLLLFEAPMSVTQATKAMADTKAEAAQAVTASQLTFEVCSGGSIVLAGRGGGKDAVSYLFDDSKLLQSLTCDTHSRKADGPRSLSRDTWPSVPVPCMRATRARSLSPSTPSARSRPAPDISTERGRGQLRAQRSNDVITLRHRPLSAQEDALRKSMTRTALDLTPEHEQLDVDIGWPPTLGIDVLATSPSDEATGNTPTTAGIRERSPNLKSKSPLGTPALTDAVTVSPVPSMSCVPTRSQLRKHVSNVLCTSHRLYLLYLFSA